MTAGTRIQNSWWKLGSKSTLLAFGIGCLDSGRQVSNRFFDLARTVQ